MILSNGEGCPSDKEEAGNATSAQEERKFMKFKSLSCHVPARLSSSPSPEMTPQNYLIQLMAHECRKSSSYCITHQPFPSPCRVTIVCAGTHSLRTCQSYGLERVPISTKATKVQLFR